MVIAKVDLDGKNNYLILKWNNMHKVITTNSNPLLVVEVSVDARNFQFGIFPECLWYDTDFGQVTDFECPKPKQSYKILGLLKDLKDDNIERFCEHSIKSLTGEDTWRDYEFEEWEECFFPTESFMSLLKSNGFNLKNNLLIIELLP